jgi:membrane fusion protein, multidrug efflux system
MMTTRLLPLVTLLALAACSAPPPPAASVLTVKTLIVGTADADSSRRYSGAVHARHELPVAFRIGGKLLERKAELGSSVAAGQVLARLDPADVGLQADQARAQLAYAEADAKRYRELQGKNFVSPAALDAKETAFKAAQAQAGLAANQRGYANLVAERAGVIAEILAEPGQVLAAGQPVVMLAADGEREVHISLPESERAAAKVGDPATITLWASQAAFRGHIRELSPAADPATRSFTARIAFDQPTAAVILGMSANVQIDRPPTAAIRVPLTALFQRGDQAAVWVVRDDQTVALTPVTVATYSDAGAVVGAGLKGGERIVAAGVHRLNEGEKVRPAP